MAAIPLTLQDVSFDIQVRQIPRWIKTVEDMMMRKTFLYRRLTQGGRVIMEPGGYEIIWPVKIRLPEVTGFSNHTGMAFEPTSTQIQMRQGMRNLKASDSLSMVDEWINQGEGAFRKLIQEKADDLREAMDMEFEAAVYYDGEATGYTEKYHGVESGFGAGTCTSADRIAAPSDTYANQSTVIGTNGGFWTANLGTPNNASLATDWPDGSGDAAYDCLSPKLINTYTLAWGTGSTAHGDNLYRAISQGMVWMGMTGGEAGTPDLCPTDSVSFQRLRENQEAKLRLQSPVQSGVDVGMPGWQGSVNLDGLTIYPDFYCPVNTSYLLKTNQISLRSRLPGKRLFLSKGPIEIPQLAFSKVWALFASGDFMFKSFKHLGKIADFVN